METYYGHIRSPADAIIVFEACRLGALPSVQRRLSEKERGSIRSGSVFVWDEREAGMRRWTDGKSWSASRVSGSFLTYREMEGKRLPSGPTPGGGSSNKASDSSEDGAVDDDGIDGYKYKPAGLTKQSFSVTTVHNQRLHLISYYARAHPSSASLLMPTLDPALKHVRPPTGMYPDALDPPNAHSRPQVSMQSTIPVVLPKSQKPFIQQHREEAPYEISTPPSGLIQQRQQWIQSFQQSPQLQLVQLLPSPASIQSSAASLQPRDIPEEKLGWPEDARALRILDREFHG